MLSSIHPCLRNRCSCYFLKVRHLKKSFSLTFIGLKPVFVTTNVPFGRAFNSSAVIIRFFFHKITSSFMIFSFTRYFFRFKIGSYKVIIKNIFGITSSIRYNLFGFKLCFFQIFDSIDLSMKFSIIKNKTANAVLFFIKLF